MKKGLILAAALVLVATSALASSVVNSKHNLNQIPGMTNASQEVCVFCHTPHAAIANNNAPLWNRNMVAKSYVLYNSATIDRTNSFMTVVSSSIAGSDAPLCISCHDGTAVGNALVNEPNAGAISAPAFTWANPEANIGGGGANIDLSNDHPIGMIYNNVQGDDLDGFFPFATVTASLKFYDDGGVAVNGKMWCSTCHDVHDDAEYPFLATTNTASALCVTCHNK
jgi:predicted CXXCH cytochrome family protein